jgi:hypothetical protein
MARKKVTIRLDQAKAEDAPALLWAASASEAIDLALDRLIRAERLRRDVAAYRRIPPTDEEVELALLAATGGLDDETDWEAH